MKPKIANHAWLESRDRSALNMVVYNLIGRLDRVQKCSNKPSSKNDNAAWDIWKC